MKNSTLIKGSAAIAVDCLRRVVRHPVLAVHLYQ